MKKINLLDELNFAQQHPSVDSKMEQMINDLFQNELEQEQAIINQIESRFEDAQLANHQWFDSTSIYDIEAIRKVAIQYRLRFLESPLFKGEIPYEALVKIKEIQKKHNVELKQFYVLAPAKMFQLSDCNDDPMLFIPLNDGKFHLIHKWGKDMSWYQKWLSLPFKNITTLVLSMALVSALFSLLMPSSALSAAEPESFFNAGRLVFFLWLNLMMAAAISYCWFAFNFTFSEQNWRSKFFNF